MNVNKCANGLSHATIYTGKIMMVKFFSETKLHAYRIKFMTVIQFILKFKIFSRDSNCIYM